MTRCFRTQYIMAEQCRPERLWSHWSHSNCSKDSKVMNADAKLTVSFLCFHLCSQWVNLSWKFLCRVSKKFIFMVILISINLTLKINCHMHYPCLDVKGENQLDMAVIKKNLQMYQVTRKRYWKSVIQNWYKNCKLNI